MKKITIITILSLLVLLAACDNQSAGANNSTECNHESVGKKYIGKGIDECSRIRFACEEGSEYFSDDCGCGCKEKESSEDPGTGKLKATDCKPEQRNADACTRDYNPVCGWFDSTKIQCIKYPCAQTFSNQCGACSDEKVISWTEGECPA